MLKEKGNFMISSGQITSLSKITGIFIILITISIPLKANDSIDNYLKLGEEYYLSNQYFLSYQNFSSAFILEEDSEKALVYGNKALESCINLNRINEGRWLIDKLSSMEDKKEYYDSLSILLLLKNNQVKHADIVLSDNDISKENMKILNAYSLFLKDDYIKSREVVNTIKLNSERLENLKISFNIEPDFNKKSPVLAGILSGIIPGAGQIYTGHTFDALNSLTLTGLLGGTSGVLWYYEMERDHNDRNYFLPTFSTVLFSFFYITNIYNSVNSANRYNSFQENKYYGNVLDKFKLIINDTGFFLGYRFK